MRSSSTKAEINLDALVHNYSAVKKKTGTFVHVIAVVKADAYGHGAVKVALHLEKLGVSYFGVAFVEEAVELRKNGIKSPLIVFFEHYNPETFIHYRLTPVINDSKTAYQFSCEAQKHHITLPVHINIDTGMGRDGIRSVNALKEIIKISSFDNLKLEGLMTHFSTAERSNAQWVQAQLKEFCTVKDALKNRGITFSSVHCANSGAVLGFPETHFNTVRPGLMLYGYSSDGISEELKPVMTLKSAIEHLKKVPSGTPVSYGRTFMTKRESLIASVAIGYADGYSRLLSNQADVLIQGNRAPIVGRVCMDLTMVDVTDVPDVKEGDDVVIIGTQGSETITADEIAQKTGTISYEVLTSISSRVKRIYHLRDKGNE